MKNKQFVSVSGLGQGEAAEVSQQSQALILGDGPRIPPLRVEELTSDLLQMINRMMQINSAIESRDQAMLTDLMSRQEGTPRRVGGYTTIWDRLCGTVRSNFESDFNKVKERLSKPLTPAGVTQANIAEG